MLTQFLYVFGSALAIFLIGANGAFVLHMGRSLTTWFLFKVIANLLIMCYMAASLFIGDPGPIRAGLGLTALLVDVAALSWMWLGIERLRSEGVHGFIPIAKLPITKD